MITDKEINGYLKAVQRNCPPELRTKIKADLENNLYDFCEENPQADLATVTERFGTPEAYAAGFAEAMPSDEQAKAVRKAHHSKKWKAFTAVLLIIVALIVMLIIKIDKDINTTYYYTEVIIDEGTQVNS